MQTYTMHTDPGHGWLEVPLSEVKRLRLDVSPYSYRKGAMAYLEEDCDFSLWLNAKRAAGEPFKIQDVHSNDYSPIREFERF